MVRVLRAPATLAACMIALAACGSSSPTDQAKSAVKTFLNDIAKGDGAAACGVMTADARRLLESTTSAKCEQVIKELGRSTTAKQRSEVAKIEPAVSVRGATALASYTGVTGTRQRRTLTLQKIGGKWKVSQLPTTG